MDSTLLIDVLRGVGAAHDAMAAHPQAAISVMTWIEVMVGARSGEETQIEQFLRGFEVIQLSAAIAEEAVRVRSTLRLKLPDAIILATAHVENRVLLTRNARDFRAGRFVKIPYTL
jgi:predicted nucleic acid-binding protein